MKWVGGKGQLLPELRARVLEARPYGRYHEPFVGGGALFFELYRNGLLGRKKPRLSDTNPNLLVAYVGVRDDVEAVINRLKLHRDRHCEEYYYAVRAHVPVETVDRAARFIYLNKTCYNGLYRENSRGLFNVPMGRYKNPLILDEDNLRAVSRALKRTRLEEASFLSVRKNAREGDLVYFDPPYHPVSKTANFTSYEKSGFGAEEQRLLAETAAALTRKGVKVILSNSYTDFICDLYRDHGFTVEEVFAKRNVNSRADRRGKVSEALIRNF
jgi:DNA adenine methylase